MKKILVTGAGGYIGSVLVPKLLANGYQVLAVDRFFFGEEKLLENNQLQIIQDDNRKLTPELFKDIYGVIDLAAISNDPSGEEFQESTTAINADSRINNARLAKTAGVERYILPSSASIYGFHNEIMSETSPTNPLTTYAKANEKAETEILKLADSSFTATVIRQATVFGLSPRMRFDLAVNGMTYGAFATGELPLMRDGNQYRPFVHIQDTTDVMLKLLEFDKDPINGEIFNVGSDRCNYQLSDLARTIADEVGKIKGAKIEIILYGDPDHRSYRLNYSKIEATLSWQAKYDVAYGVREIASALEAGKLKKDQTTLTLDWYKELVKWHKIIKRIEKYGGIIDIE